MVGGSGGVEQKTSSRVPPPSTPPPAQSGGGPPVLMWVTAMFDYPEGQPGDLTFGVNDTIGVVDFAVR